MTVIVDKMTSADWPQVHAIYLEGIATGNATFETEAPEWERWNSSHLVEARLVARDSIGGFVMGWAALSPVSDRCVYAGVAEVSIYIGENFRGQNVGTLLMVELIKQSEAAGFWTLQAGILPENQASLALHQKAGFRVVGRRERIGQMKGVWRDTLLLERRSPIVGRPET